MVSHDHRQIGGIDADGQGLGAPPGVLVRCLFRADHLRSAGLQGRDLRRLGRGQAPLGHGQLDLLAPLGEQVDQLLVDAGDVGEAVVDRRPGHTDPFGQLVAEVCLVEVPGGARVVVKRRGVDRAPPAVRGPHRVRYQHVGVQQRVPVAGGAVPEPRSDESVRRHPVDPVAARPGEGRDLLHVGDSPSHGCVVRSGDHACHFRLPEAPEDRHRLRGPEREVPAGHLAVPCTMQPFASLGIAPAEHGPQVVAVDDTVETEVVRRGEPVPGRLAGLGVVVLDSRDYLVEVVGLGSGGEAVKVQHPDHHLDRREAASVMQVCDPR